ncbi:type II toxin-antitoxin system HicA family toxin [Winogradskyella flava]|uniref:type II toxin-antitoxin system HicA family toxin n=1 Tax=Winogradskyella flava TaxID=1884876 RepID=UPI002491DC27|nr:type II toxin-antitoxin system HicA family toxin [Winogradskyella flava]
MSTRHLRNVTISKLESFLELCLCKFIKNKKGHAQYTRADLTRPLPFQNHIEPVPEFIVKNILRGLGYSKNDFHDILENKKEVIRKGNKFILQEVVKKKK